MKYPPLALIAAGLFASAAAARTVNVDIDAGRPGPVINKNLYGAGNFDGAWVGPQSKIPNIKGWRKDMVAALKALQVPVLRWPAGCDADQADWRDGIGPRRAAVGTHEFFDLVELLGAEAYVNGNVGTGSPREAAQWVEYMLAEGGSSLATLRAKNGHPNPFKVAFFGVGNAPWGCGGNMSPQYYADLYNQYAVFIRGKTDKPPTLVASGAGAEWTDELSTKKRIRDYRFAISAPLPSAQIKEFIDNNVAMLDKNDAANKTSLVISEWGSGEATAAALHFHVFHAHSARLNMAITSQPMIRTEGSKMVLTPAYYAFKMHVPFQDAASLPVKLDNNPQHAVSASAARAKNGKLYLSLVNTNPNEAVAVAVAVAGAQAKAASGGVLTADGPTPFQALGDKGKLLLTLKAKSVTVLAIESAP
jgi:alpha-N-arabinofuranosidase